MQDESRRVRSVGRDRLEALSTGLSLCMLAGVAGLPALTPTNVRSTLSPESIAQIRSAVRPGTAAVSSQKPAAPVVTAPASPVRVASAQPTGGSKSAARPPASPVSTVPPEAPTAGPGMIERAWASVQDAIGGLMTSSPTAPASPPQAPSSPVRTVDTKVATVPAPSPVQTVAAQPDAASPVASPVRTFESQPAPVANATASPPPAVIPTEKVAADSPATADTWSFARLRAAVQPLIAVVWRWSPTSPEGATPTDPAGTARERSVVVAGVPATAPTGAAEPNAMGGAAAPAVSATSPGGGAPNGQPPAAGATDPKTASAAQLFGALKAPANMPTRVIGTYSKGCLAGAQELAPTGPAWQVMRLSRNRNWGHPSLVRYVERLASDVKAKDGWPGLLVGDLSQPRGGPMTYGHASHQVGLDVDVWYLPMPDRPLSLDERDKIPMPTVLVNPFNVDPALFTPAHAQVVRRAASYPGVERVLVHPAVKKALCESADGDRAYLRKVRPYWGHDDHFHVRVVCPPDSPGCQHPPAAPADDGCGKELEHWLVLTARVPTPQPPSATLVLAPDLAAELPKPVSGRGRATLDSLPPQCRVVHAAPAANAVTQHAGR